MATNMEPMFIKDIRPGLKSINVTCIVLEVGHPVPLKEQREVRTLKVADATACINLSVWDEPGQLLVPGDIVRLTNGYASIWRKGNCLTLYTGKSGGIDKIGEFCMVFNEQLNMSDPNSALVNPMPSQPPGGMPIINNGNVNNGGVPVNRTSATPQVAGNKTVARFGNEQPALGLQSSNKQSTNKTIQKANRGGPKSTLRTERR